MKSKQIKPLKIGELTAKLPIIQGGMGVGVSLSSLAGAVAAEGGIGVISTAQIGFYRPDFEKNPLEANLKAIKEQVALAKEKAKGGIIGANIMVATRNYKEYVTAAVRAGVDVIISGAGLPRNLPEYVRDSCGQNCTHCFFRESCKSYLPSLGQKSPSRSGYGRDRRTFGGRSSGLFGKRAAALCQGQRC